MDELSFGQWLSRQRKSLGLTQKQLADCVNCATITIRKIEAEQRRPSVQIAQQLAQAMDIPSKEQPAFLRFARGYGQPDPASAIEIPPWRVSTTLTSVEHLSGSFPLQGDQPIPGGVYYLDSISDLYSLAGHPQDVIKWVTHDHPLRAVPDLPEGAYLVLMVPIKLVDQAVLSGFHSIEPIPGAGETSPNGAGVPIELHKIPHPLHIEIL